jgi:RimJ/RimL family protein N-acetyltransferase
MLMSNVAILYDKQEIGAYLWRDPALHLYAIGDLDDFFWTSTVWYGLKEGENLLAVALLYTGGDLPTLLATARQPATALATLLSRTVHLLPQRFYAHLSPEARDALAAACLLEPRGLHFKMALRDPARLNGIDVSDVERLTPAATDELLAFYAHSYPGNWFDPRMVETGQYVGIRGENGNLLSVAGVHVYSAEQRVAALGNITTAPAARGRGLATAATAALCRSLLQTVDLIGLNVRADNVAAIACYRRLGFTVVAEYEEYMARLKQFSGSC